MVDCSRGPFPRRSPSRGRNGCFESSPRLPLPWMIHGPSMMVRRWKANASAINERRILPAPPQLHSSISRTSYPITFTSSSHHMHVLHPSHPRLGPIRCTSLPDYVRVLDPSRPRPTPITFTSSAHLVDVLHPLRERPTPISSTSWPHYTRVLGPSHARHSSRTTTFFTHHHHAIDESLPNGRPPPTTSLSSNDGNLYQPPPSTPEKSSSKNLDTWVRHHVDVPCACDD